MKIKISATTRIFHQIVRLSNTERDLSFQAMRQLYIACITSVADYEVPVWWNNQKFLLEKYQKLQNSALKKILEAFKKQITERFQSHQNIITISDKHHSQMLWEWKHKNSDQSSTK